MEEKGKSNYKHVEVSQWSSLILDGYSLDSFKCGLKFMSEIIVGGTYLNIVER